MVLNQAPQYSAKVADGFPTNAAIGSELLQTDTGLYFLFTGIVQGSVAGSGWVQLSAASYSSNPAAVSAFAITTGGTFQMAGYSNGPGSTTVAAAVSGSNVAGQKVLAVAATTSFYVGEIVAIDAGLATAELATIASIQAAVSLTFVNNLLFTHVAGGTHHVRGSSAAATPGTTGRFFVMFTGTFTDSNTAKVIQAQLSVGSLVSADAPANGANLTGTQFGPIGQYTTLTGVLGGTITLLAFVGGPAATNTTPSGGAALAIGVPVWFDLAITSTTSADTVAIAGAAWVIYEF